MRLLMTAAFLLAFLSPAYAAAKEKPLPDVPAIEAYLNSLSTLKSRFVQTTDNGKQVTGTFMLKRPGRMRFEYDPPIEDFIVADGTLIYYYDGQMKQQSSVPISKSLADFFLRTDLKLSGDITVSDLSRANGALQATLTQSKDQMAGTLTLLFSEDPLRLKKWRIVDAQGTTTEVELYEVSPGIALSNSLFHYYDPDHKKTLLNK